MAMIRKWQISTTLPLLLASSLAATPASAAKLYRWVDDEGNVHFTDRIPADQVDKGRTELNERGLAVEQVEAAKSPEELAKEAELERLRREQQRVRELQEAEDQVLLRSYHSVDDMLLSRDGKLNAVDVMIGVSERNNKLLKDKLAEQEKQAANLERSGKPIPPPLQDQIGDTRNSLKEGYAAILRHQEQKAEIRDAYDRNLRRFRELKHLQAEEAPAEPIGEARNPELANVYQCQDAAGCDQAWERAENFVREFSTTKLQRVTEHLITTKPPLDDKDISLTVARLPNPTGEGARLFLDVQCRDTIGGLAFCQRREVELLIGRFQPYMRYQIQKP